MSYYFITQVEHAFMKTFLYLVCQLSDSLIGRFGTALVSQPSGCGLICRLRQILFLRTKVKLGYMTKYSILCTIKSSIFSIVRCDLCTQTSRALHTFILLLNKFFICLYLQILFIYLFIIIVFLFFYLLLLHYYMFKIRIDFIKSNDFFMHWC